MSYNDDFLNFRAECISFAKERKEAVIKSWLRKIGYTEPVGYYLNSIDSVMEIYATRLGALIGNEGRNIEELENMLHDEFSWTTWKVKLIEVRGGFVGV